MNIFCLVRRITYFCANKRDNIMIEQCKAEAIGRVNKAACKMFGISIEDIYCKNKNRECTLAKSYAIHCLHVKYGLSASELAREYCLHKRVVFWHISKIENYINIYSTSAKEYNSFCALVEEKD